jgi:hypothetical protein
MAFRVVGLSETSFQHLYGLSDSALAERGVVVATSTGEVGFPCRVSLRDASAGARMLLMNYEHQSVRSPYQSSHAIYVQDGATRTDVSVNEVPDVLRRRLLSIRAFDQEGMIVDADVVDGNDAARVFDRLLTNERVDYLHVHNAKRGCYAARVERA